jgi:predicted RND superfamily exporter protein
VILTDDREQAIRISNALKEKQKQLGKESDIASVQTLSDFVPPQQEEKIVLLKEMRSILTPKIINSLEEKEKNYVKDFLTEEALHPFVEKEIPKLILEKFAEKDGTLGRMVVVEPPLSETDDIAWNGKRLINFIHLLRDTADSVKPGTPVAGQLPISADMVESITEDGPKATTFALIAVVLLVIILFRDMLTIGYTLFALFLGLVWMAGMILAFKLKINFLNFIALPITFGIGVDYGVNVFQRYLLERKNRKQHVIIPVIKQTGGAVMLASLTTVIGYGSLVIASNQAFVSFGTLAVMGEITCITAAVLSLPAFLLYQERKRNK